LEQRYDLHCLDRYRRHPRLARQHRDETNAQQGMILNIVVGIVGAFLGGLLLAPLFGTGTINQSDFSIGSLFVSFLGAIILLAIVNFFRRRRVHT